METTLVVKSTAHSHGRFHKNVTNGMPEPAHSIGTAHMARMRVNGVCSVQDVWSVAALRSVRCTWNTCEVTELVQ